MKKTYKYKGKENLIFSLGDEHYNCITCENYEIDSQDEYVKSLVACGLLVEVQKPATPKQATAKTQAGESEKKESSTL